MKITFQNLLHFKDDKVTGAMSPVMFGQQIERSQIIHKVTGLLRIHTPGERVNQKLEGKGREKDLTGHDTLLLVCHWENDEQYQIWIDTGTTGIPVASYFKSDSIHDVKLHPMYEKQAYLEKFTVEDVKDIFFQALQENTLPVGYERQGA